MVIPAYKPDEKLLGVIRDLKSAGVERILVVNDGSGPAYDSVFREVENCACELLVHDVNRGKGAALKTAFQSLLDEGCGDVICTADADGQHLPKDILACLTEAQANSGALVLGGRGFTVAEFAERFDAVAAINAGGFVDDGGMGDGSTPDSLVVFEGAFYSAGRGTGQGFVGLDSEHRLHVGIKTVQEIRDADIQYGVCFGPVLIRDGAITDESRMQSEVNPRSAIGQREDGTILLLVVAGRQVASLGATILDMARVMADYGAVNACNLDGGTSSLMWYDGAYLNRGPLLAKPRPVPDAIIVLPEGG